MTAQFQRAFSFFIASFALFNIATAGISPAACDVDRTTGSYGATARFYDYDSGDTVSYNDNAFLSGGYLSNNYVGSISDVQALQEMRWSSGLNLENPPFGFTGVPIDHFVVEITGYYFATQTGIYNANLKVEGSAALFMGSGLAFDCCGQQDDFTANTPIVTNAEDESNVPKQFYLETGSFYPFKLVYVNNEGTGAFELEINRPDGSVDLTVGNNVYSFGEAESSNCNPVSYSHEFTTQLSTVATTTVTYTTSAVSVLTTVSSGITSWLNDDNGEITVVIVVEVPVPIARTSYTTGPVTEATAITTITTFTTGTDGNTTPDTIIVIETPPPAPSSSSSSNIAISSTSESVSETTTIITSTDTNIATVSTATASNTTPATSTAIVTSPSGTITSPLEPSTSSSSSTGMIYGNSTSQQPSSQQTSNVTPSQSTPSSSAPATQLPTPSRSSVAPSTTSITSQATLTISSTTTIVSTQTTKVTPSTETTPPAGNGGNGSAPGSGGSHNNDDDDDNTSAPGNEGSSNNDGNGNASAPGNEGSNNNNGNGNPSDNGADNDASEPGNGGSSNSEGSSNNGEEGSNGAHNNDAAGTVTIQRPHSSATVTITSSLSAYEGVGALVKKWSFTSIAAIALLAII